MNSEIALHHKAFGDNQREIAKYKPGQTPKMKYIITKANEAKEIERINGLIEPQKELLQQITDRIQKLKQQIKA